MTCLIWILLLCDAANAAVVGALSSTTEDAPTRTMAQEKRENVATTTTAPRSPVTDTSNIGNLIQQRAISLPGASGTWMSIPCDATGVVDENPVNMTKRYVAAGVPDAWKDLMKGWNSYYPHPTGGIPETFVAYYTNAFHLPEGDTCLLKDPLCQSGKCPDNGLAPATYLIQDSMATLSTYLSSVVSAFEQAQNTMSTKTDSFVQKFAKIPNQNSNLITKIILDVFLALGLVLIPTAFAAMAAETVAIVTAGSVTSTLVANTLVSSAVFIHNMVENEMKDAKTYSEESQALKDMLASFVGTVHTSAAQYLQAVTNPKNQSMENELASYVVDGSVHAFYKATVQANINYAEIIQATAEKTLWGMALVPTWRASQDKQTPFVLRVDRKDYTCNATVKDGGKNGFKLSDYMSDDTRAKTIWCDKDGNSFFLLNANTGTQFCPFKTGCAGDTDKYLPFQVLDGGDRNTLMEYTGISLEDIILASYGGFLKNGKKNGYVPDGKTKDKVNPDFTITEQKMAMSGGVRMPGFFNITVCTDAATAEKNIRSHKYYDGAPCKDPQTESTITPSQTANGWTPGTCGIHITQWRAKGQMGKDPKVDDNPLDVMQISLAIKDDVGKLIGYAPKQPFKGALNVKSSLPSAIYATSPDDDTVEIWYAGQHFTSKSSNCNMGKYWGDGEDRQGDCTFPCAASDKATTKPNDKIVNAYYGVGPNKNEATLPSIKEANTKGSCGLHIRQYQVNEAASNGYSNPNPYYALELTLYDADQKFIGYQSMSFPKSGTVSVQGLLKYQLLATSGKVDSDPISLAYAGSKWETGKNGCGKPSGFKAGFRDADCSFDCSKGT